MAKKKESKGAAVAEVVPEDTGVVTEIREADSNGNRFMPGMEQEVKVIPELRDAVKREKLELVPPFQSAQRALQQQKEQTKALVEKHKHNFFRDEANGLLVYDDGEVVIKVKESDTISYEVKKESEE